MKEILKCPVCNSLLNKINNSFVCENKHSYDISRKGSVNLLLANQTHSDLSGDNKEMIEARVNFLNTGKYNILLNNLIKTIEHYFKNDFVFVDLGCGEGYYTTAIHNHFVLKGVNISSYGIDLSKSAINECTIKVRKEKLTNIQYIVGNLAYLPFKDESIDLSLNCFAKIEEKEFYRTLKKDGIYIRVLPSSNHLLGMKKILYENVHLNEAKEEKMEGFTLIEKKEVNDFISLNNKEINDLFKMTPYYYKTSKEASNKLLSLDKLETEISFLILVYKKENK